MDPEIALLKFSNLHAVALVSAPNGDAYKRQEELVAVLRETGQPFMATMLYRHLYHCKSCDFQRGEAIYHIENPLVPANDFEDDMLFGQPVGICAQIKSSQLHHILVHNNRLPQALQNVLSSVSS